MLYLSLGREGGVAVKSIIQTVLNKIARRPLLNSSLGREGGWREIKYASGTSKTNEREQAQTTRPNP